MAFDFKRVVEQPWTLEKRIREGLDPNLTDDYGSALLHHAITQRNVKSVELLLAAGADPNKR